MQRSKTDFRVVALSATPGTDINAVRLMLQNLLISNIELRSEDSPDIVPYTFQRTIEKIVVPMGKELEDVRQKFLTILEVRRISMYSVYLRYCHRFFDQVGINPCMDLLEISIFSLNHVIVRPTKIMNNLLKDCKILTFKVIFQHQKSTESF